MSRCPSPQRRPTPHASDPPSSLSHPRKTPIQNVWHTLTHHAKRHVGVGIVCAVAYFDPGNWSTDLQAGSQFGYKLLCVVLIAGLGAVILQVLACKLGCVTGLDLASHTRLLLHDHPKYPKLVRRVFLYPLYALSELAIISTDLAELLGSAIGLVLLFPSLPLPVAVALTAFDVLIILAIRDPSKGHGRPVRVFEWLIILLVLVVFISFTILIVKVKPHWPGVFEGYLPSKTLVSPNGLYAGIGILGATVMPHALYLGSYLATQDRVATTPRFLPPPVQAGNQNAFMRSLKNIFIVRRTFVSNSGQEHELDVNTPHGERDNNTLSFIKAHLSHQIVDIVCSLMGFAVVINSAILVLAGAVFFFGPTKVMDGTAASLFDAHDLIRDLIGKPAAVIFALALVCAGQTASITATLAGQIVSEGFIQWSISPVLRRLITRLIGLVPAMTVALVVGKDGISNLLVISQVILSIVLPFVTFPLIWLTSSSLVMRVKRPPVLVSSPDCPTNSTSDVKLEDPVTVEGHAEHADKSAKEKEEEIDGERISSSSEEVRCVIEDPQTSDVRVQWAEDQEQFVDYSNGWALTVTSYVIWLLVLVANGYLIVTLALR